MAFSTNSLQDGSAPVPPRGYPEGTVRSAFRGQSSAPHCTPKPPSFLPSSRTPPLSISPKAHYRPGQVGLSPRWDRPSQLKRQAGSSPGSERGWHTAGLPRPRSSACGGALPKQQEKAEDVHRTPPSKNNVHSKGWGCIDTSERLYFISLTEKIGFLRLVWEANTPV